MNAEREMPQYQCHKKVWALKIKRVDYDIELVDQGIEGMGKATLVFVDGGYAPIEVDASFTSKHKPVGGGYFVVYEDGYKSFSPADAFETGYTLITPTTYQDRVRAEKAELDDKLDRLLAFVKTNAFKTAVHIDEQERMLEQVRYMQDYSAVLGRRIEAF